MEFCPVCKNPADYNACQDRLVCTSCSWRSKKIHIAEKSLVRFNGGAGYPFEDGEILLFLGEIHKMEGHCIVVKSDGRIFWGYHTQNFEEIADLSYTINTAEE
jgi:hypothetical protein